MKSRFINNAVCGLMVTALLGLGAAGAARADGHAALKQELRMLTERLQELEAKLAETEDKVDETRDRAILSTGKSPGSFLIPGTDTEFSISGYVKADFIYDLKQKDGGAAGAVALKTKTDSIDDQGHFQAHARQSRLRISTTTPTPLGDLNAVIETDFFGAGGNENQSNSYGMRLRHAYARIGGLLAGQYWTNFGALAALPPTLDFTGAEGSIFIRQAQVRWTQSIDDKLKFAVSLENPEASEIKSVNGMGDLFKDSKGKDKNPAFLDRLPDAVVALEYNDDWGQFRLSALGRQLTSPDDKQDELAYGINVGVNFAAWPGGNILGSFTYGDGIGRYLASGGIGYEAFYNAGTQNLDTIKSYGIVAGVKHKFTDTVTGLVAIGRQGFSNTPGVSNGFTKAASDGFLKQLNSVHTSVFWSPLSRLTIGGEVIYYDKEIVSGDKIENIRLQTSVQLRF